MSQITKLHRERPRDRFVRCSLWIAVVSLVAAWLLGDFAPTELFSERRLANLSRFLGEIRPYPLQGEAWDWAVFWTWARDLFRDRGAEAIQATLAIAVLAIVLAASLGSALALGAARNLCTAEPYVNGGPTPSRSTRLAWRLITTGTRWLLVALRVMPEYLLAFLLVGLIGPSAWPAVLALAIHNTGILGRLYAETIENTDPGAPGVLRALGGRRRQIAVIGLWPLTLPRLLLYFFYRWETCVREATVLGLLGVVSLGYWIVDARARGQYDTMLFFVLLGSLIVLVGDLLSALARSLVRRS